MSTGVPPKRISLVVQSRRASLTAQTRTAQTRTAQTNEKERHPGRGPRRVPNASVQQGSALLFVLLACLVIAVVIQAAGAVILCGERALVAEKTGRSVMAQTEKTLVSLRDLAACSWQPLSRQTEATETAGTSGTGEISPLAAEENAPLAADWLLRAAAYPSEGTSGHVISATLERGRDGLDLPFAALVAGEWQAAPGRQLPWVECDGGEEVIVNGARCYVRHPAAAPVLGAECQLVT
ncbi:MAG: hypothetical protein H5T84_10570, partial [Thermoleophilia bacterium]|nr:hypothetical protein [Thermoleophilia bacterium]